MMPMSLSGIMGRRFWSVSYECNVQSCAICYITQFSYGFLELFKRCHSLVSVSSGPWYCPPYVCGMYRPLQSCILMVFKAVLMYDGCEVFYLAIWQLCDFPPQVLLKKTEKIYLPRAFLNYQVVEMLHKLL